MKVKTKNYIDNNAYSILKNKNFKNNQNYIFGKKFKSKVLNSMQSTSLEFLNLDFGKIYIKNLSLDNYFYHIGNTLKMIGIIILFIILFIGTIGFKDLLIVLIGIIYLLYSLYGNIKRNKIIKNYKIFIDKKFIYYIK